LVAHKEGAPGKYQGCKEEIRTYSNYSPQPTFTTAYGASVLNGGDEATNADVTSSINVGTGIVNYRGHGSYDSWLSWNIFNESYTTSDARGLTNGYKTPIVFSIACSNSQLDNPSECLAEAFTKADYGATAFLGATRGSYTLPNHTYDKELYKALFDFGIFNIGDLSNSAACKIIEDYGYSGEYNAKIYLWLGDPTMEVWTDTPSQFTDITISDNGSSITVNAGVSGATICVSSGDNGASYYLVADNVSQYTFTTTVRPLYITITKHNYIPYTAVTGGTFTSDEYWFGNMHVLGTVRFDGNSTLTVLPGTKILFEGDYDFAVKSGSRIIAEGTEDQQIYFTAANPSGRRTWGTLFVNGSNNILKHCIVEYGDWGLKLSGSPSPASDNVVENCIFRHNDQGLRIQNNTVDVRNCQMYDNRHNVVLIGNQDVDIEGCRIYNGDRDGVYSSNGNYVELYGNVIENNGLGSSSTRNGIYTNWNEVYYIRSYNTIRNNYSSEVAAYYDDMVDIEYSSVHDDNGYEVYSNSGIIFCTFSWWGECPPDYSQFYGDLILRGYLCSQPAWEGQTRSGGLSKIVAMNLDNNDPDDDNITYESLKEKILSNPYFQEADSLLGRMYVIARKDFRENKYGLRKSFYNNSILIQRLAKSHLNI